MTELFKATFWFVFGAISCLLWLALPLAIREDDALGIASMRGLGCEPYMGDHGELHSGCQNVKPVTLKFGEP